MALNTVFYLLFNKKKHLVVAVFQNLLDWCLLRLQSMGIGQWPLWLEEGGAKPPLF
jgi:hypothetical protein